MSLVLEIQCCRSGDAEVAGTFGLRHRRPIAESDGSSQVDCPSMVLAMPQSRTCRRFPVQRWTWERNHVAAGQVTELPV
jgi:hypothetical protein